MTLDLKIHREDQATIGRYVAKLDKNHQEALISYTRPRANLIYLTFARIPEGEAGQEAIQALMQIVIDDAQANGDRIVLADIDLKDRFSNHAGLKAVQAAA